MAERPLLITGYVMSTKIFWSLKTTLDSAVKTRRALMACYAHVTLVRLWCRIWQVQVDYITGVSHNCGNPITSDLGIHSHLTLTCLHRSIDKIKPKCIIRADDYCTSTWKRYLNHQVSISSKCQSQTVGLNVNGLILFAARPCHRRCPAHLCWLCLYACTCCLSFPELEWHNLTSSVLYGKNSILQQ